ncbi:MAG: aminotransferase class I/II-fold pyridoxal phosphate-dependent enzyme [Candidatus Competibacteraceae bacterium]|nr:aminotransferase class I/II-fold pyridoxal phosphate-dependent enzyme [Candidatus Competibacteraceae bacterium]
MGDIFDKILKNPGPLGQYAKMAHGYFAFPKLTGEIGPRMFFNGREVLVWSLNNYLGLANHPEVRKADADAAAQYGLAYPMGARMMTGESDLHEQLEQELAAFVDKPAGMLMNYGYQGIMSVVDALLGRHDVVVYDAESHACLVDGVRLHAGKRFVYKHNDMESLEKQLEHARNVTQQTGGGILVITEGVFGMSGAQGNLKGIAALKDKYNFRLLVDDAHGVGTMGPRLGGTGQEQGVQDKIDVYFGTFAKSFASIGAFIAATPEVIQFLKYNTRSQIFAKSLPMPLVVGALKRLELMRTRPELKDNLWKIVHALQTGLRDVGLNIGKTNSPVTPVVLTGSPQEATHVVFDIREKRNIFCSAVVYPVIPKGTIILRLIPTAVHSLDDVQYTIQAFAEVADKLKNGLYNKEDFAAGVVPKF